jgi:hypothetical protein
MAENDSKSQSGSGQSKSRSASRGKSPSKSQSSSGRSQSSKSSGRSQSNTRSRRSSRNGDSELSAREAVERVREDFPALLGRPVEAVLGVERDEDDEGWHVMVQVVELARIPNSTDVLGAYLVTLDNDGELAGYRRRRRYNRSQADED